MSHSTVLYADLVSELHVATRAWGEDLRQEWQRVGGPRKESRYNASIDAELEIRIRETLQRLTPTWGIVGEEGGSLDRPCMDGSEHVWHVDPNDGTEAYLMGMRGSTISLGLTRKGEPVLGVVHAYAWPDDDGLTVTWYEGGSLQVTPAWEGRRPGQEKPLASDGPLTLVSQHAWRYVGSNQQLVDSGRFLALPSIALRLALVACGQADAMIGTQNVYTWDVVAGHALLRGAGLDLWRKNGKPVRYADNSTQVAGPLAAGPAELATALAKRASEVSFTLDPNTSAPRGQELCSTPRLWTLAQPPSLADVQPTFAKDSPDAATLKRIQGALLGQLVGDALGAQIEFQSAGEVQDLFPSGLRHITMPGVFGTIPGQPTDDSELALMLARSLVSRGLWDAEDVAAAYVWWYNSPPFDMGATTSQALGAGAAAQKAATSIAQACMLEANPQSQANGALMRCIPLAIFASGISDPLIARTWLVKAARQDAALTHPHQVCVDASVAFLLAAERAIRTGEDGPTVYRHTVEFARNLRLHADVQNRLRLAADERPDSLDSISQGWVLLALHNAMWHLAHHTPFEEALVQTMACGGDTDTNGCITGALLGAVHGRQNIPLPWRNAVLSCVPAHGMVHVNKPRLRPFWPIDAMNLAEALWGSGRKSVDVLTMHQ
jgi:ADP-ribosyl-[dinitrogen reductase] hydrolase